MTSVRLTTEHSVILANSTPPSVTMSNYTSTVEMTVIQFINSLRAMANGRNETVGEAFIKQIPPYQCVLFDFIFLTLVIGTLCIFGIVGNALSIYILRQDTSNKSVLLLLQALGVSDSLNLFLSLIALSVVYGLLPTVVSRLDLWNVRSYIIYLAPFGYMANSATVWITVLLAVNRYVAVCMPLHVHRLCTLRRTRLQIAAVFICSLLFNIPRFFQYKWSVITIDNGLTMTSPQPTVIGSHSMFGVVYTNTLYSICFVILPLVFLLVLNVRLIMVVKKHRVQRRSLTTHPRMPGGSITKVMIIIVVCVVVCHLPDRIFQMVLYFTRINPTCPTSLYYIRMACNFLIIFNSSTNFLIYYFMRKQFRVIFRKTMYCAQKRASARSDNREMTMMTNVEKSTPLLTPTRNSLISEEELS